MMTREISLPPCERFTVLESRANETVSQCDVCDEFEVAHPDVERRTLPGGEIEELRKRMIVDAYEKIEAEGARSDDSESPTARPEMPFGNG